MADKIANFEDYKKREERPATREPMVGAEAEKPKAEGRDERPRAEVEKPREAEAPKAPVPQETMNIEIEDPYQFLNAEEREEYILQRQKEMQEAEHRQEETPVRREEARPERAERREEREPERPRPRRHERPAEREEYPEDEDYDPEFDEEYGEDRGADEGYDEEDEPEDKTMLLVVRIASIITGIVILFFIGMVLKTKVFDRYLAPDPDEAPATATVALAIPAGFTEKNDTVVVAGASSLNLRSGPDTSSTVMGQAAEGTELKRIAVGDDGHWALVEFEGQQVYASMKYLKEK